MRHFLPAAILLCCPPILCVAASQSAQSGGDQAVISIASAPKSGLMRQYKSSVKVDLSIGEASPADGLTWPQAVAEAQQHNPSLIEAKLFIQEGEKQVDIGDAGFLPTVTANAGINRGQGQQIVNGSTFNTSAGSYQGSLDGTWNLFDGFSTLATRDLNLAAVQNRRAAYDQASSALYLSLGEAFDQLLYDQNNLALQKVLVERYRSDTLYQEQEFKGGLTALWTYEKAQSDEASQVWSFKQAKYSMRADQAALAILLGRDADAPDLCVAGALTVTAAPEDFHADLQRMLQDNPTLRYYRSLVAEDDAALWSAESTRYPSLSASGSWGSSGDETWGPRNKEWQGSLNLSYELFAGGGAEAAITQADEALRQAETSAGDQLHQWEAALLKAWTAYIGDYERLPSAAMAVRAGADRFATVGALYQSGREEFLDYEQAESIYSAAQSGLLGQLLAAAEAQVAYRNTLGMTLEDAAASPAP